MDISDLCIWFDHLAESLSEKQKTIATEIIKEIKDRLLFLVNVGNKKNINSNLVF